MSEGAHNSDNKPPQGWYPNWEPRKTPVSSGGWARNMRIKDVVYFQHVTHVYQEVPGIAAWLLEGADAAHVMLQDDIWHQPHAEPVWQANSITHKDLAFLAEMRITLED